MLTCVCDGIWAQCGMRCAGVHPSADGAEVATPLSLVEWFQDFYAEAQAGAVRPVEGIVRAGELLFVPRGWWHLAMNLEVCARDWAARLRTCRLAGCQARFCAHDAEQIQALVSRGRQRDGRHQAHTCVNTLSHEDTASLKSRPQLTAPNQLIWLWLAQHTRSLTASCKQAGEATSCAERKP